MKMGLGQLRGPFWGNGTLVDCPNQILIVALGQLGVCAGEPGSFVTKNSGGLVTPSNKSHDGCDRGIPSLEKRETWGTHGFLSVYIQATVTFMRR
jgi:hypothetical protein